MHKKMRSLLVLVCLVICFNELAALATDSDACFILPAWITPGRKRVDGIVANFGRSEFWLTVQNIGVQRDGGRRELIGCARRATFSFPNVPDELQDLGGNILLQLNASFVSQEGGPARECQRGQHAHGEGRRKRHSAAVPASEVLLYTQIPIVHHPQVLIQLSHAVYNPGDYVQYRILLTDGLIRPLARTDSPLKITVTLQHESQNTVESRDVQLHPSEIYSGQYLLADDRDLGRWNLTVTVADQTTRKPFEVASYSAPVHKITIDVIGMDRNELLLRVAAKYTFGKPIRGTMTVSVSGGDLPFAAIRKASLGDTTLVIPMDDILDPGLTQPTIREISVNVTVEVSDDATTKRTYGEIKRIAIHPDGHRLTLHRTVGFEPGLNATMLVQLTSLDGKPHGWRKTVWITATLYNEYEQNSLGLYDFEQTLELDGTAVVSVPTTADTEWVSFIVTYRSLPETLKLESAYEPELFVRIVPQNCRTAARECQFKLGIASSHLLDGLIIIQRNQAAEVPDEIVYDDTATETNYFERFRGPLDGLKNVHLFGNVRHSEMLVQTSVSHVKPQLPYKVNMELEYVDRVNEIKIYCPAHFGVVGVAIYEGQLDLDKTDSINRHLMFNGTHYSTPDEYTAQSAGQVFVTPSTRIESGALLDHLLTEKPTTRFNRLLLWKQAVISPSEPVVRLSYKPPPHVSQLTVTAFSFSNSTGLDVAAPVHWMRNNVFEIHLHVPYSVYNLEPVSVEVYVVNNRAYQQPIIAVELWNTANEFHFLNNSGQIDATRKTSYLQLRGNEVRRTEFLIRPKKLGSIVLEAIAYGKDDMIATAKTILRTVPEQELKTDTIVRPFAIQNSVASFSVRLSIPASATPGTEKVTLALQHEHSKMAALSTSQLVEQLVRSDPVTTAVRASLTLDVLRMAQIDWPERHSEASALLTESVEEIERHARPDGSFDVGKYRKGRSSVCWDAVVAVQALTSASRHLASGKPHEAAVDNALRWLNQRQAADGSYCSQEMFALEQRAQLTAHVLLALASKDTHAGKYADAIDGARRYLRDCVPALQDPYHLALVAYAVQFSGRLPGTSSAGNATISTTVAMALETLWPQRNSTASRNAVWWSSRSGRDLEATSYALLMLVAKNHLLEAAPLVNWIKRRPYKQMPIDITPDAHVALRALIAYAKLTTFLPQVYTATVVASDASKIVYKTTLQRDSRTHVLALPPDTRSASFTIHGTITGAMEINYSYMQSVASKGSKFNIRIVRYDESNEDYVSWGVCIRFVPKGAYDSTRMVTCEFSFPSGYIALDDSVDELQELDGVVAALVRNDETQLVLTFEEITVQGRCFNVGGFRRTRAAQLLPGTLKVFDVSDPLNAAFKNFAVGH